MFPSPNPLNPGSFIHLKLPNPKRANHAGTMDPYHYHHVPFLRKPHHLNISRDRIAIASRRVTPFPSRNERRVAHYNRNPLLDLTHSL